ncbi:ATP-binding protein [Ferruginibacter sp.]
MFPKILLVFFFTTFFCNSFSQQNAVDSFLNTQLNAAGENPLRKADAYNTTARKFIRTDLGTSLIFSRKALEISTKEKYVSGMAMAYCNITTILERQGKIDAAFTVADSAAALVNKDTSHVVKWYYASNLGNLYRRKANYPLALQYYQQTAKIAEDNKDEKLTASSYNLLGIIYLTTNDLDRAEEFHKKSLVLRTALKDSMSMYYSYDNLGIVNRERKNYDKALEYYFKAKELVELLKDSAGISFMYNDIGAAYSFKNQTADAEKYLKASIGIRERNNELHELAYTYNYLGENYERKGDLVNAEAAIKKALSIAVAIKNNKQLIEAHESLADFFSRNKKYDSAYVYEHKYKLIKDSIIKKDQQEIIAELTTKYETEKQKTRIKEQQLEITKKNYWLAGILGGALVLMAGGYSFYKRRKLKQETRLQQEIIKQQDLSTKAVIAAEENERKRIASDLHDGVGQMMSAAKMNLSAFESELTFANEERKLAFEKIIQLVDEGCKEVRNVSHQMMPNALLKQGLASAIKEFIDKIDNSIIKVTLHTEGLNERLNSNTETVLYRVIQECVNNVIKHANANVLDIALIKDKDGIAVTIEDNGRGFDSSNKMNFEGIGLKNIISRIEYLKGNIEFDAAPGKGTLVAIHIPKV